MRLHRYLSKQTFSSAITCPTVFSSAQYLPQQVLSRLISLTYPANSCRLYSFSLSLASLHGMPETMREVKSSKLPFTTINLIASRFALHRERHPCEVSPHSFDNGPPNTNLHYNQFNPKYYFVQFYFGLVHVLQGNMNGNTRIGRFGQCFTWSSDSQLHDFKWMNGYMQHREVIFVMDGFLNKTIDNGLVQSIFSCICDA